MAFEGKRSATERRRAAPGIGAPVPTPGKQTRTAAASLRPPAAGGPVPSGLVGTTESRAHEIAANGVAGPGGPSGGEDVVTVPADRGPRLTLQMLLQRRGSPVQPKEDPAQVHAAAERGAATAATQLPHLDQIQRSFGHHDVSGVKAHAGAEAAASASAMGAAAYATGDHVVLGAGRDLHTEAHEAAHVVQQRGGVQLKGGVGQDGDAYERHADAVADLVVQGKSAASLLDGVAGGGQTSSAGASDVQHVVQRVETATWNERISKAAPGTASKAKLGAALIEALKDRGVKAYLGGSLVAAVFGAQRVPGDIDLEIPGQSQNASAATEVFQSMVSRPAFRVISGTDIFFIVGWDKASGVFELKYRHAVTQRALDPDDSDDEDARANALASASDVAEAKVDISSESVFESSMNTEAGRPKDGEAPVTAPVYLIASYLDRLAANTAEGKPDEKADRAQAVALLNYHIKSLPADHRPTSKSAVASLIRDSIVKPYINDSNKHAEKINELVDDVAADVAGA